MTADPSSFDARTIDASLVRRLIAAQFPEWSGLPVRAAIPQGWDNRTFRLGEEMAVRLPSAAHYVAQIEKEHAWLPRLASGGLPLRVPVPLAIGDPGEGYPWPWSVYRWLEGETAATASIADVRRFALDLAGFLCALRGVDATDGPPAGPHCFWRGGPLATYDAETRAAITTLGDRINRAAVTAVWEAALSTTWPGPPVSFHGDVAIGNLLVDPAGALSAVIDFGCCGVGDPACDLVIAWTFLEGESREAFRLAVDLDADTWARARGWALWKALIVLAAARGANMADVDRCPRVVEAVIAEHRREAVSLGR